MGIKLKRSDFHTLSSYVSYNRWSGRLVGTMATWPFTDAVVDLLGNRSYNKTNGQRTSSQGGLEYEITLPEAAKLRLGARYAVWRTSGMATSWQIELPFIITDLVKRRLNIERVRWVEPAVSVSFNVFAFHIVYSLTQMIPVDVEYRVPAAAPEEREIRGGRFHWLTLTRSL